MNEITGEVTFNAVSNGKDGNERGMDMSFSAFGDGTRPSGEVAEYRLAMVKSRDAFLDLFEGARHVDAITYAETPDLMVRMLTEYDIGSLDVLIGNADEYAERVNSVETAQNLLELRQQERLTVRLKNQKTIHSKIYRIEMPDDSVKLVHGSANLSVNSWEYHTNQVSVFTTTAGSSLDDEFSSFIQQYRDSYSDQTLLEGLVEAVEDTEDDIDRDERIEYWVETDNVDVSDIAALNQDATEEIAEVADRVTAVVSDPEEADETVALIDGESEADHAIVSAGDDSEHTTESSASEDDLPPAEETRNAGDPAITLAESDNETAITDTLDRPRVRTPDETIRIGTNRVGKEVADEFGSNLRERGATVEDHSIATPLTAYNNQVQESIKIPSMTVVPESDQVVLGGDTEMILVATDEPDPAVLDHCLETIELYIETVEDHGHTQNPEAIMAQMYEAFLYGFWAPFANQYAEALSSPSRTLNNVLQHLYIEGDSDAGKDKLVEYILRLLSDNTVVSGVDADQVGIGEIRGIREWDTCFPYAVIDAEKRKIQDWSPIRNYWGDWTPTSVNQPCLIFTTNDALPKSEFRNRMKILSMDVSFPSNAKEPGFKDAQKDLTDALERQNPIFGHVARRMMINKPWNSGNGTIADVREIFREFYEEADRTPPTYFPGDEPAEKKHDTGRLKWQRDIQGGRVTFEPEPNAITAEFERDGYEVFDFEKRLPKRMMSDKSGTDVYIGAPNEFADWIGFSKDALLNGNVTDDVASIRADEPESETNTTDDDESGGILSRLLNR